jgi:hypothetical protein
MSDNSVILGPYAQGEIPESVIYTFLKADGTTDAFLPASPAFTAKLEFRRWNTLTPVTEIVASVLDQTVLPGQISWNWTAASVATAGDWEGELWVGNVVAGGSGRFRSQRFRWVVTPAVFVATV